VEDYQRLSERFPKVSAWMLGRGMLRNPFLAEEIKGQDVGDKKERFLAFYQDFIEELLPIRGESGTLANLKELWHYFAAFAQMAEGELQRMLRICDLRDFMAFVGANDYSPLPQCPNGK
jgi:tRNA-dihydrouridine synthase